MSAVDLVAGLNTGATSGNESWVEHAGKYYLKEEKAPEGYIKMQEAVEVVITADIEEEKDKHRCQNEGQPVEDGFGEAVLK